MFALQAFASPLPGIEHLWFITIIFICYILTPFVYCLNTRYNYIFVILIAVVAFVWFSYIKIYYQFSLWILTYFLGYFVRYYFDKISWYVSAFFISICLLLLPFYEIRSGSHVDNWMHAIGGAMIFLIIYSLLSNENLTIKKNRIFTIIDDYSYEIYLTHKIYILGPFAIIKLSTIPIWERVFLILILITISSYCLKLISTYVTRRKLGRR